LDDKVQNSQSTAMMKSRCRRKNHQIRQLLAPCFAGPQIFDVHFKVWLTYERDKVWLSSLRWPPGKAFAAKYAYAWAAIRIQQQAHCLNHLYTVKPRPPGAMQLRTRGHQFELPANMNLTNETYCSIAF